MEKESVKKFDLEAAFKALDEIDIPVAEKGIKANRIDLKERFAHKPAHESLIEDYYDVSSNEDLEDAQEEREGEVAQAKLARIEKIVDLDAETPEDLLPSYVGKVIMQCPQCMTLFYKNPEDIEHSEENPDVVNINEVCQHCGNTSGYTLIGKVDSVSEEEADNYAVEEGEAPAEEENELDLDFEEPTEEVDAEGTGEAELSDEEMADLDLELEGIEEEESEEEKKEESLNLSKVEKDAEKGSDLFTEHKSENLTLNESTGDVRGLIAELDAREDKSLTIQELDELAAKYGVKKPYDKAILDRVIIKESINNSEVLKDAEKGSELKTENESENLTLNEAKYDAELTVHDTWKVNDIEAADEEEAEEIAQEKIDNGEEDDYSEYDDGIQVTKIAEGLNEEVDKDLDKKLKAHNDYIAYLQQMIKQEEEALKKAENDEIKAAIQRRFDAFNADLEAALPDAVKEEAPVEEIPETAEADETPAEEPAEEPAEVQAEEEAPVKEQLTEEASEEEPKEDNGNEIDYVEYKHSYCHALAPKLKAINYLVNVKKVEPKILKGYILKLLKDADVKWTEKEKEFKKNIEAKEDVYDILNYVKNSIEKAKTIKVKVDENGELIESLNEGFEGCLYEVLTESLNNSEAQKDAEEHSELKTENESENLTLNEDVGDDEIARIISSWNFDDVNEALESDEDAEQDAIDADVKATVDSWDEALKEDAGKEKASAAETELSDTISKWGLDEPSTTAQPTVAKPSDSSSTANETDATPDNVGNIISSWESLEKPEENQIEECNKAILKEETSEDEQYLNSLYDSIPEDLKKALAIEVQYYGNDDFVGDISFDVNSKEDIIEADKKLGQFLADNIDKKYTYTFQNPNSEINNEDTIDSYLKKYTDVRAAAAERYPDEDLSDYDYANFSIYKKKLAEGAEEPKPEESLNEEADVDAGLDQLLDSEEFQKPVSDAEVEKYFDESAEEPEQTELEEAFGDFGVLDKNIGPYEIQAQRVGADPSNPSVHADDPKMKVNGKATGPWFEYAKLKDADAKARAYVNSGTKDSRTKAVVVAKNASGKIEPAGPVKVIAYVYNSASGKAEIDTSVTLQGNIEKLASSIKGGNSTSTPVKTDDKDGETKAKSKIKLDRSQVYTRPADAEIQAHIDSTTAQFTGKKLLVRDIKAKKDIDATDSWADALAAAKKPENKIAVIYGMQKADWEATNPEQRVVLAIYVKGKSYKGDKQNDARLAQYNLGLLKTAKLESYDVNSLNELDEASFNAHVNAYLTEVYSNVKLFEATGCELKEDRLIVEGKITFNSGKERTTIFEFLPSFCEDNVIFEGYNKDFATDSAFTLGCSINESKELITESFSYSYKINEALVEGLK